jgi:hypothetical protein
MFDPCIDCITKIDIGFLNLFQLKVQLVNAPKLMMCPLCGLDEKTVLH